MGCRSKNLTHFSSRIPTVILFLSIFTVLEFGMIKPVVGVERVETLTNQCTKRYMQVVRGRINARGIVRSKQPNPQAQLILISTGHDGTLKILTKQSKEYICFNSKGRLTTRSRGSGDCEFKELHNADNTWSYRSLKNSKYRIGFRKKGKKLKGDAWQTRTGLEECYHFSKPRKHRRQRKINDMWAPRVNWTDYNINLNTNRQSAHRRNYKVPAPNENRKWAPKVRRSPRKRHSSVGRKT